MRRILLAAALPLLLATMALAADPSRQADVARRGAEVMPFSLDATTHVFTKTPDGGLQKVVAKDSADSRQVALVRQHLRDIRGRFAQGDFSAPEAIHGQDMPGLAALRAARPGQIKVAYRPVEGGAELSYRTRSPELVGALHQWFDAQLDDHGRDATAGHMHHHGAMHMP